MIFVNNKPILVIEAKWLDKCLEVISILLLVLVWTEAFAIGTDASFLTDYGNNLILALLASLLFSILTLVNKYPHKFNYPVNITTTNASIQYFYALRMVRSCKCGTMLAFYYVLNDINSLKEFGYPVLGIYNGPIILVLLGAPLVFFINLMYKNK